MSDIMERTIASLPGFLTGSYGKSANISPGFQHLIHCIGDCKSKQEEEKIMKKEIEILKHRLLQTDINKRQMREYLVRLIYCEMLGQDASFGYIHALKFVQQGTLLDKRVGYLAVTLFLHENHELIMLLINTIQKDLQSTNIVEVCIALTVVCKLINTEMIPAILPLVEEKLQHPKAIVRTKAVMALYQFYRKAPNLVQHIHDKFRKSLCDKDPGVMSASLNIYYDLIKSNPDDYSDMVSSLVDVFQQVIDKKLPSDYEYYRVPAPWLLIKLLKMMSVLGSDDENSSAQMYEVLGYVLKKLDIHHSIAFAVLYECILTICNIRPNTALVAMAARCVGKFLESRSNNLKYLGITALSAVIKVNPSYASEHQLVVIDCLDDPDETIKVKTLDLLFKMTNQKNIEVIFKKVLEYLNTAKDNYIKKDLVAKITDLAEKYSPNSEWYLNTINHTFLLAGDLVPRDVSNNLVKLLSEDTEAVEYDRELRLKAVGVYYRLLRKRKLPDALIKVVCWVLGEFSYLDDSVPKTEVIESLFKLLDDTYTDDSYTCWIFTAIMKITSQSGVFSDVVNDVIIKYKDITTNTELRQRVCEFDKLSHDVELMRTILPVPTHHIEIDSTLSFLDEYVSDALAQGAATYKPKQQRQLQPTTTLVSKPSLWAGLNFKPYESPTASAASTLSLSSSPHASPMMVVALDPSLSSGSSDSTNLLDIRTPGLNLKDVKKVWSKEGYSKSSKTIAIKGKEQLKKSNPVTELNAVEKVTPQNKSLPLTTESSPTSLDISDEEMRKLKLANALFSGVTSNTTPKQTLGSRAGRLFSQEQIQQRNTPFTDVLIEGVRKSPTENSSIDLLAGIDFMTVDQKEIDRIGVSSGDTAGVECATGSTQNTKLIDVVLSQTHGDIVGEVQGEVDNKKSTRCKQFDSLQGNLTLESDFNSVHAGDHKHVENISGLKDLNINTFRNNKLTVSIKTSDVLRPGENISSHDSNTDSVISYSDNNDKLPQTKKSVLSEQSLLTKDTVTVSNVGLLDSEYDDPQNEQEPDHFAPRLPQDLKGFDHSKEYSNLTSDSILRVLSTKVWKSDSLIIVLFLQNQSIHAIKDATVKVDVPSNLKAVIDGNECNSITVSEIIANCCQSSIVTFTCIAPSLNMVLGGQICYKDKTNTSKRLFFNLSIYMTDLLRPLKLTTDEFGVKWKMYSNDKKLKLQIEKVKTIQEFMNIVQNQLHIEPVDIIGQEAVAAGRLLQKSTSICLLHAKLTASKTLELWMKSDSVLFSEALAKQCSTVFI